MNKSVRSIIGAASGVTIVLLLHLLDLGLPTYLSRGFVNAMHTPAFGVLAIGLLLVFRQQHETRKAFWLAAITAAGVGVLAELLQLISPRDADLLDLGRDLVGIAAGLGAAAMLLHAARIRDSSGKKFLWRLLAIVPVAIAVLPAAWIMYASVARSISMPRLLGFEQHWERQIYSTPAQTPLTLAAAPDNWPQTGRVGRLLLDLSAGVALTLQPHRNWNGYTTFSFLAGAADSRTHRMYLRVHDSQHNNQFDDRFNYSFIVTPLPQRYRIPMADIRDAPATRQLDIASIAEVMLFIYEPQEAGVVLVDDFRLEND